MFFSIFGRTRRDLCIYRLVLVLLHLTNNKTQSTFVFQHWWQSNKIHASNAPAHTFCRCALQNIIDYTWCKRAEHINQSYSAKFQICKLNDLTLVCDIFAYAWCVTMHTYRSERTHAQYSYGARWRLYHKYRIHHCLALAHPGRRPEKLPNGWSNAK